ncbi:hypothetical protein IG631_00614 [Alternaria alternata]|nr:hypothetical protein IG631_00614 [Alternaria alternata]
MRLGVSVARGFPCYEQRTVRAEPSAGAAGNFSVRQAKMRAHTYSVFHPRCLYMRSIHMRMSHRSNRDGESSWNGRTSREGSRLQPTSTPLGLPRDVPDRVVMSLKADMAHQ